MKYFWGKMAFCGAMAFIATIAFNKPQEYERLKTLADARLAIEDISRDPYSIKYDIEYSGPFTACGTFNARNAFGAYVGKKRFVYTASKLLFDDPAISSTETFNKFIWDFFCHA